MLLMGEFKCLLKILKFTDQFVFLFSLRRVNFNNLLIVLQQMMNKMENRDGLSASDMRNKNVFCNLENFVEIKSSS